MDDTGGVIFPYWIGAVRAEPAVDAAGEDVEDTACRAGEFPTRTVFVPLETMRGELRTVSFDPLSLIALGTGETCSELNSQTPLRTDLRGRIKFHPLHWASPLHCAAQSLGLLASTE